MGKRDLGEGGGVGGGGRGGCGSGGIRAAQCQTRERRGGDEDEVGGSEGRAYRARLKADGEGWGGSGGVRRVEK